MNDFEQIKTLNNSKHQQKQNIGTKQLYLLPKNKKNFLNIFL